MPRDLLSNGRYLARKYSDTFSRENALPSTRDKYVDSLNNFVLQTNENRL